MTIRLDIDDPSPADAKSLAAQLPKVEFVIGGAAFV